MCGGQRSTSGVPQGPSCLLRQGLSLRPGAPQLGGAGWPEGSRRLLVSGSAAEVTSVPHHLWLF